MPVKGGNQGGGQGGRGSGDVRAGGAWFEIYGKDGLTKTLESLEKRVTRFSAFMKRIGTSLVVGGGALAAGPLALLLGGTNRLAEIDKLAREFQVPIEVMNRLQYAAEMAGVSVQDVINDTKGRFRDLLSRAPAIDPEQVRQATAVQREYRESLIALQFAMTPLLSVVSGVAKAVGEFVRQHAAAVRVIGVAGVGLFALGLAFKGVGIAVAVATAGVGLFLKGVTLLLSPLGLVSAAVAGLTTLWLRASEQGRQTAAELGQSFRLIGETFAVTWGAILDAVKAGDLKLAFRALGIGVKAIFFEMLAAMAKAMADFLKDMHRKIVALAVIAAGLKGVAIGGRLGPLGAVVGGLGGGIAAGVAADAALEELEGGLGGLGDRLADRARAAREELAGLRAEAGAAAAAAGALGDPDAARRLAEAVKPFAAVKGNFNVSAARQQFGYGDAVTQQTELQRQIVGNTKKTAEELVNLVLALRFA